MAPSQKNELMYGQLFAIGGVCSTVFSLFTGDGSFELHFRTFLTWGLSCLCLYVMCSRYQLREKELQEYSGLLITRLKLLEKTKSLSDISQEQQKRVITEMVNIYNAEIEKEEREGLEYRYPDIADISKDRGYLNKLCKAHNLDIEIR